MNSAGTNMNPQTNTPLSPEQKPIGPVFGLVIILILILAGGIYFLVSKKDTPPPLVLPTEEENTAEVQRINTQSTSDDTASIEADLNAFGETDINNVDSVE